MSWKDDTAESGGSSSAKCPNCSSNIFFNEKIGRLVCNFCGGIYIPETLAPTGSIENRDTEDAGEEENNKQEFICDSCGAAVVTDYNTSATFCAFCGSPTLIKRRLSRQFRPDVIIPFKVSKEEAIKNYSEWVKTHPGVPKEFRDSSTLDKITGFYVPFWLIDADCTTMINGSGEADGGADDRRVAHFTIDREVDFKMKRVPFDGCKKISNLLMEAIEPFDYSDLVPYNDMYLPGFYAQRYDTSALDMLDLIGIRFDSYAMNLVRRFAASEYSGIEVSSRGSYAENFSQLYALLPVWFLNVKYKGLTYGLAVNGQTGEASGNLPISKWSIFKHSLLKAGKLVLPYILFMLILSTLVSFVFKPLGWEYFWSSMLIVNAILALGGAFIFWPLVVARYLDKKHEESMTLDPAPGLEEYIDYKNGFNMRKNDRLAFMTSREDDILPPRRRRSFF